MVHDLAEDAVQAQAYFLQMSSITVVKLRHYPEARFLFRLQNR